MTPTFILFRTECINSDQNSVCHIILVPVVDGVIQESQEFFLNPDAPFQGVMSGISREQVESFAPFAQVWPSVHEVFCKFDVAVCAGDGYSAHALFGTLSRLGIPFNPIKYCNAKAICRRSLPSVSFGLDYLNNVFFNDYIPENEVVATSRRWAQLAVKGLESVEDATINDFLSRTKIKPGLIAEGDFQPSLCIKVKKHFSGSGFDAESIAVNAQPENPFYGMCVVFTGKMEALKRNDARELVVRIGGEAPDRLTQDTDFLVVGVQDLKVVGQSGLSGKMKTAAKYREKGLPIEVIDEDDFIRMIGIDNVLQMAKERLFDFPAMMKIREVILSLKNSAEAN